VVAALTFAAAPRAPAADLYGDGYSPRAEAPYEDPGYADSYRYPPPRGTYDPGADEDEDYNQQESGRYSGGGDWHPRYGDREWGDAGRYPPHGSTRDDYLAPMVRPPRFADVPYNGCLPSWRIRHRLRAEGWSDLRPLDKRGEVVIVRAVRRDRGQVFTLRIDRCSGAIVDARPERFRTFGSYAPPRRFDYRY
jgi:hypothetical protein